MISDAVVSLRATGTILSFLLVTQTGLFAAKAKDKHWRHSFAEAEAEEARQTGRPSCCTSMHPGVGRVSRWNRMS